MKKTADSYGTQQKEKVLPLIGQLEQEVATARCGWISWKKSVLLTGLP